jgi:hypothetical protein
VNGVVTRFRKKRKKPGISRGAGDEIILREKKGSMVRAFELLAGLPKDFSLKGRGKDKPQKRSGF